MSPYTEQDIEFILKMKDQTEKGLRGFKNNTQQAAKEASRADKQFKKMSGSIKSAALQLAALAGAALGIGSSVRAFGTFEEGLIGIKKTTGESAEGMKEIAQGLIDISTSTPVTTQRLTEIGIAAGQMGVKGANDILTFTEAVSKMESATNLAGEDAALTLSRMLTLANEPISAVENLGSAIVALGNQATTSEREIAGVALEVSRGTAKYGLASKDVAALATTFAQFGSRAELSGTAVSRALGEIEKGLLTNSKGIQDFAKLAGTSVKDIKKLFAEDAYGALMLFLETLGGASASDRLGLLEGMNLQSQELNKTIGLLAEKYTDLQKNQALSDKSFAEGTALTIEAEAAYKSMNSSIARMKNSFAALAAKVGSILSPAIIGMANTFSDMVTSMSRGLGSLVDGFKEWAGVIQTTTEVLGVLLAMVGSTVALKTAIALYVSLTAEVTGAAGAFLALRGAMALALVQTRLLAGGMSLLKLGMAFLFTPAAIVGGIVAGLLIFKEEVLTATEYMTGLKGELDSYGDVFYKAMIGIGTIIQGSFLGVVNVIKKAIADIEIQFFKVTDAISQSKFGQKLGMEAYLPSLSAVRLSQQTYTEAFTSGVMDAAQQTREVLQKERDKLAADVEKAFTANLAQRDIQRKLAAAMLEQDKKKNTKGGVKPTDGLGGDSSGDEDAANKAEDAYKRLLQTRMNDIQAIKDRTEALRIMMNGDAESLQIAEMQVEANRAQTDEMRGLINKKIEAQREQTKLNEAYQTAQRVADDSTTAFKGFFKSMITGAQSASEAFAELASRLADVALEAAFSGIGGQAQSGIFNAISGLFFAQGAAFSQGSVVPFAKGGVVSSPSFFPMSGGQTGMMGEAGPEAVMPLTRMPDGSLGVKSSSGSGAVTALQYSPTISIVLEGGGQSGVAGRSQEDMDRLSKSLDNEIRSTVLRVLEDEKRIGGSLNRGVSV